MIETALTVNKLIYELQRSPADKHTMKLLIDIGSPAVDPLIKASLFNQEIDGSISISILGEIGDNRAVEPLISWLIRDPDSWGDVAISLGKIGDKRAIPYLIEALNKKPSYISKYSPYYRNKREIIKALSMFDDERVLDGLIPALDDHNDNVRIEAALALVSQNNVKVRDALKPKIDDSIVVASIYKYFIKEAFPNSEIHLIKSLNLYGTKEMALDLLNCGNSKLDKAAEEWANKNGYVVHRFQGENYAGPIWGKQ